MGGSHIVEASDSNDKGLRLGRVLKGLGGFYTVEEKSAGGTPASGSGLWECRLRGRFRREKQDVLPGDFVAFDTVDENGRKGVVERVLPRTNRLTRPTVANVDQVLIVLAADYPQPDLWLLDRLLVMVLAEQIHPLLCWNKEDLAGPGYLEGFMRPYEAAGFRQVVTCALDGMGLDRLITELAGKTTVLAGPSGVGKSSLLNKIDPRLALKTGEISEKLGRGRHTTRHVELFPVQGGGYVADTPGFSSSELLQYTAVSRENLQFCFREFAPFLGQCRYPSCAHHKETGCAVKTAMEQGKIHPSRYANYVKLLCSDDK